MQNYENYEVWKGWSETDFGHFGSQEGSYFAGELEGIGLKGKRLLEIGFGTGKFLSWAKSQGAKTYGTEIIPSLLRAAEARGHRILESRLKDNMQGFAGKLDVVAAFDVLEHLSRSEIGDLLDDVAQLLTVGGTFIARFPNGQSPFGLPHQHGDWTHRTALSKACFEQLLIGRPFQLVRGGNSYRPKGRGLSIIPSGMRNIAQSFVEFTMSRIYGLSCPLGPNITVHVTRVPNS